MRRLLCVMLIALTMTSLCIPLSFADSNEEANYSIHSGIDGRIFSGTIGTMPREDYDLYGSNDYIYKTEYLPKQYIVLKGFAGGNSPGVDRFETGGGFWFTDYAGPTVSGGLTINYLGNLKLISVSVSLGKAGSSGKFVSVPDTEHYYKLYVEKTIEITPYITYKRLKGNLHANDPWTVYLEGHAQKTYKVNQYAKRVG